MVKKNDVPLLPNDMTLLSVLSIKRQEKVHIYLCTSLKFQQCFTATVEYLAKARWWALILFWKKQWVYSKEYYTRTIGPMWTNFDQCGPIWTNGDADHLQLAKITTKWLQSGKSADSQLQICNSAPRTAANVPITCWQASSSARGSTPDLVWPQPDFFPCICLLLPLLPPSLLGKLLVLHLTTSACKR